MATTTLAASAFAYVNQASADTHYTVDNSTWYTLDGSTSDLDARRFIVQFASVPTSLRRYKITKAEIVAAMNYDGSFYSRPAYVDALVNAPDMSTVTWNTADFDNFYSFDNVSLYRDNAAADETLERTASNGLTAFVNSLCAVFESGETGNDDTFIKVRPTLVGGGTMYAIITYDSDTSLTSQVTYKSGPNSGYSNPRNAITFQWAYEPSSSSILCADDSFEQASATFYWKSSSDASYTAVSIADSTTSVTIAANTFPTAETISWYVEGTDEDGTTTQTSVYIFSTAAGTVTATCSDPVDQVIDGSADYTFSWVITSTDGQNASRTVLQWSSDDGSTWTTLMDESDHVTSYTVTGGTFSAGTIYWKVSAYNIDGTLGTAGTATFICVAAPDPVSGLAATEVPLSTISWQSSDQQAYEITIDGVVVQKAYGTDAYNWTVEEPLEDGNHVISVRVQGIYGYWSQPSSITITVSNTPDTTLTLTGDFSTDAYLSWDYSTYTTYVYRDGVRIGESDDLFYTDRRALGSHTYYVEQWIGDGNYNRSNTVTGTMSVSCKMIAPIDGSASWLKLKLSENSYDTDTYNWNRINVTQHVVGAIYPQIEVSTFENKSGSFDCAFTSDADIKRFEALQGKLIILKCKGDNVITGLLSQTGKKVGVFYTSFTFTIQHIYVEDYEEQ